MSLNIENYLPPVLQNGGLSTALPVVISSDLTVTGTTNIGNISLNDLSTTGNTALGNATSDTLTVTGNSAFTGTATGNMVDVVATATTTGIAVDVTGNTALTTGQLVSVASSATAITTTGRLFSSAHSGATGTSATLNEFSTAATDETVLLKLTASAALAAGKVLSVSGAAVTTGILVDISDSAALTTGQILNIAGNSADTGTRSLVKIAQSNASASGATALEVSAAGALAPIKSTGATVSSHFQKFATAGGVTIWISDGTTANAALSGTAGDLCLNAGSNKPEYCTGTTNWTALV